MIKNSLLVLLIVGVAAGAYYLGQQHGTPDAETVQDVASPDVSGAEPMRTAPHGLPAGHALPAASDAPAATGSAGADPNARFTHFRVGQRNVKAILPDGDIMWVGTSAGVIRYDLANDEYRLFDTRTGLLANGIFHLSRIQGRLMAGTYGGGLAVLNEENETWKIYNIPDGLGDGFIYDAIELSNGDVWIATWSGANRVRGGALDDKSAWDLYTVANTSGGLPNDWVYALRAGTDGDVWFATEGGLAKLSNGKWQNWGHEEGLGAPYELVREQIQFKTDPAQYSQHHARQKEEMGLQNVDIAYNPNYIVALLVDTDGIVWAGTWGGGLARFDGSAWKNYTMSDGLPGNHVFMLHQDDDGTIWVGTSSGLARMDGESFKVFTTEDGLFSNQVFSMTTAADGSRWVGSFGGVARIVTLN